MKFLAPFILAAMVAFPALANGGGGDEARNGNDSIALLTCKDADAVVAAYEWLLKVVAPPPNCRLLDGVRLLRDFYSNPATKNVQQLASWAPDADGDPMAPFEFTYETTDGQLGQVWLIFWILESEPS